MKKHTSLLNIVLLVTITLGLATYAQAATAPFSFAKIYIEYNSTPQDLGFHISLDAEDWRSLKIINPKNKTIFEVSGKAAFKDLGMTELFFEGAEPALSEVPLRELLEMFPEGNYRFSGTTVDGDRLESVSRLSHAIPAGPLVWTELNNDSLIVRWDPVTTTPSGFPVRTINIAGYQVIVGKFLITLPASARSVTVPKEFVRSLTPGVQDYEVLTIEANGNQTITEGTFSFTGVSKSK